MQPTNAAFFHLFLEDALRLSFVASDIPRFLAGLGGRNRDVNSRGGNVWWHNQEMLRRPDRPI